MPIVRINGRLYECIDTLKIFDNQAIKTALAGEGIEYRTNKIDEISKAVLGEIEGGKLGGSRWNRDSTICQEKNRRNTV